MARYRRRAHYRRSRLGRRHHVRAHVVNRGASHGPVSRSQRGVNAHPRQTPPPAPRLATVAPMPTEPNAKCPVCGAPVYFWKSRTGSKVWFDALGQPWPKHPCLDLPSGLTSEHRADVIRVRSEAEGPLPPERQVVMADGELPGCGCIFVPLALFLLACVINWWRLVFNSNAGDGGLWGTLLATFIVLIILAVGGRIWHIVAMRRALDQALRASSHSPPRAY